MDLRHTRISQIPQRQNFETQVAIAYVPVHYLASSQNRSQEVVTQEQASLKIIQSRISSLLQSLGQGARVVLLVVVGKSVLKAKMKSVAGITLKQLSCMDSQEAHDFLVSRLRLQRWIPTAHHTRSAAPTALQRCVLCPLSERMTATARSNFAKKLKVLKKTSEPVF